MNAAALILATFLTAGNVGPLHVVEWRAHVIAGKQRIVIPVNANPDGQLLPLPPELVKAGFVCALSKRTTDEDSQYQTVVCGYGKDGASFGATATCVTNHVDVDLQRVTVGSDKTGVIAITLGCRSVPVVGAEI